MRRGKIHRLSKIQFKVYRHGLSTLLLKLNFPEEANSEYPFLYKIDDEVKEFPFQESLPAIRGLGAIVKQFNPKFLEVLVSLEIQDYLTTLHSFELIPPTEIGEPGLESYISVDEVLIQDSEF